MSSGSSNGARPIEQLRCHVVSRPGGGSHRYRHVPTPSGVRALPRRGELLDNGRTERLEVGW
jgi:hypothetical protein